MSNFYPRIVKCALCGKESTQRSLVSSSNVGHELDGRPVGMMRDTMECWVQMCGNPDCGYCTFDISKEIARARDCVKSADYRSHLAGNMRDLVKRFYLAALTSLWSNDVNGAFECFRNAAWACDDYKLTSDAKAFRMLAAQIFPSSHEPVWLADLMRRSGHFPESVAACDSLLKRSDLSAFSIKLLELERKLALANDDGPHVTKEIAP